MAKRNGTKAKNIQLVRQAGMTWINVVHPNRATLAQLQERFPYFLDIDLQDCLPPFQRPKVLERPEYLFLVMLFPVLDEKTGRVRSSEVDFFIGKDFVVTSHAGELPPLVEMGLRSEETLDESSCLIPVNGSVARWTYNVLHALFISCFPLLTRIGNDINGAEASLGETKREAVREILRIRSNIVDFRKTMQGHLMVLRKFQERAPKHMDMSDLSPYFDDIAGHAREISEFLQSDHETINAIYDSHVSYLELETNEATKTLTALAFVVFPMTLVATVFGMNAKYMPIIGHKYDFWIIMALIGVMMAVVGYYIRKKRWL